MNIVNAIFQRRSIRKYTGEHVSREMVKQLLEAAMAAPSAGNQQPWEFVVVRDKEVLQKLTEVSPYTKMLKEADLAIVVCGDEAKEKHKGYWVQDCSAATENILIMAAHLGLGAVWCGIYPVDERVIGVKNILGLPQSVIPLGIIAVGHPAEHKEPANRYDESKIHYDRW